MDALVARQPSPLPLVVFRRSTVSRGPGELPPSGLTIRPYHDAEDVTHWLRIQNEARPRPRGGRDWGMAEFDRELRGRSWWRPDALWLACVPGEPHPVGCVAVECSPPARPWAQLHWLAVRPAWRRRGIARALVERVAGQAAGAGHRQLRAETLAAWQGAVGFYERLGFQVVR